MQPGGCGIGEKSVRADAPEMPEGKDKLLNNASASSSAGSENLRVLFLQIIFLFLPEKLAIGG
jgi:hypothetical protein